MRLPAKVILPTIIFEDPHLIVLSKPAGFLSQGEATGDDNLVDYLRSYLNRHYVGLIHRLDRNTSGIMVVAKRTKSAQRLTLALQNDQIARTYLGWMAGTLKREIRWTHFLKKDATRNLVQVCAPGQQHAGRQEGKESTLTAKPVQYSVWNGIPITLTEFRLETGRSHQIRVQSAFEGFPLLGDSKYTGLVSRPQLTERLQVRPLELQRVALHSFQLKFPHPMTGEILQFEDPLPADLSSFLRV